MALQKLVAANSNPCINPLPSLKFTPRFRSHPLVSFTISANRSISLRACLSAKDDQEVHRPVAHFVPTIWNDSNIFTSTLPISEIEENNRLAEELKQKVKIMVIAFTNDPAENIILIDTICRLGVSYHFENEIEEKLHQIFEAQPNFVKENDYDLCHVALIFRVFRQHGFKMSCGVFNKFKYNDSTFKESLKSDVKGMLSLYEATHLRFHGEEILEEALKFTTAHLKSLADKSSPHLAKHIMNALDLPLHHGIPRLETRKYISFYEEDCEHRNETLLRFAKLDFNRVQLLHQQEIKYLMSWWEDQNLALKTTYARDRLVELHLWSVATYFEPCYSRARLLHTKIVSILTIIDDTYDAYGTIEELQSFTDAIQRWEINAIVDLPNYMKPLYRVILNLFDELNNDVSKEGRSYSVSFTKDKLKEIVREYLVEAQWYHQGFVPSFDERLSNSLITGTCFYGMAAVFLGMGETAGINAFEWLQKCPKIVKAAYTIGRLKADIVSDELEQKRGHVASTLGCYIKQYGVSREEAIMELNSMISNAWKDVNEECMKPTDIPIQLLGRVVSIARLVQVLYKNKDGISFPECLKDHIIKLFIHPIPI